MIKQTLQNKLNQLADWVDDRTGVTELAKEALFERIPGGPRWRYVWGSTLCFVFFVQMITGIILWAAYSPSSTTAWESVYYIQHEMVGGWLVRGIHHFMAQMMIVLLGLHVIQILIDGAYRAPREFNFWTGMILMGIVLALSLTGYLLPWDQKGYWATKVATKMAGVVPYVGDAKKTLLVGGAEYGNHTLTRFFALHAGLLPFLMLAFIGLHVMLLRKHGLHGKTPFKNPKGGMFWPEQIFKDAVACFAVMTIVLVMVFWNYPSLEPGQGMSHLGAELFAPADPSASFDAARPEWYFLSLFKLLKYMEGFPPIVGPILIPLAILTMMGLMPILGRWKLGHRFNVVWSGSLLVGAAVLTTIALYADFNGKDTPSLAYLEAVRSSRLEAKRAFELAHNGIPKEGALEMMRRDPMLQGPKLFRQHCASCHSHYDIEKQLEIEQRNHGKTDEEIAPDLLNQKFELGRHHILVKSATAPNLYRFAGHDWCAAMLDPTQLKDIHNFGYRDSPFVEGEMVEWVEENIGEELETLENEELQEFKTQLEDVVYALSAEAELPGQSGAKILFAERIERGRTLLVEEFSCIDCHKFYDEGSLGAAPDLTHYGSRQWLIDFISNPKHARFYPESNDRMPSFLENKNDPDKNRLSQQELELIVDWLRRDWYRPPVEKKEEMAEAALPNKITTKGVEEGTEKSEEAEETASEVTPSQKDSEKEATEEKIPS